MNHKPTQALRAATVLLSNSNGHSPLQVDEVGKRGSDKLTGRLARGWVQINLVVKISTSIQAETIAQVALHSVPIAFPFKLIPHHQAFAGDTDGLLPQHDALDVN